jgi:hypothetical protein
MVKTKYEILSRDFFTCQNPDCGYFGNVDSLEMAHCMKQGKRDSKNNGTVNYIIAYIERNYGRRLTRKEAFKIIHDERNVVTSCKKCNDLFNIFFNDILRDKKIDTIYEAEFLNKNK